MPDETCQCAYCREGKSETMEEYMDRRIAVTKRLREGLKGVDFKPMFRDRIKKEGVN